jgi:hypothetical protein
LISFEEMSVRKLNGKPTKKYIWLYLEVESFKRAIKKK